MKRFDIPPSGPPLRQLQAGADARKVHAIDLARWAYRETWQRPSDPNRRRESTRSTWEKPIRILDKPRGKPRRESWPTVGAVVPRPGETKPDSCAVRGASRSSSSDVESERERGDRGREGGREAEALLCSFIDVMPVMLPRGVAELGLLGLEERGVRGRGSDQPLHCLVVRSLAGEHLM